MIKRNAKTIIILIIFIGLWLLKIVYWLNKTIEFFGLIMFLFLAIIGLIIFFISLSSDIKQFRKDKKPVSLLPSVIGVVFILLVS